MIFGSFAEAVSMYLVFFQEQRKTVPAFRKTICYHRTEAVGGIFTKVFFFLVNSNMVNLLSFSVLSSV